MIKIFQNILKKLLHILNTLNIHYGDINQIQNNKLIVYHDILKKIDAGARIHRCITLPINPYNR